MLSTGQVLHERYRIVSLLGQGGFGAVYRAWDVNLNTPVALKENLNTSPESLRQFHTEARLLAGLRHPNLPYVIDHFIISEQGQYLGMEYIEGQDLGDMLDNAVQEYEIQGTPIAAHGIKITGEKGDFIQQAMLLNPPLADGNTLLVDIVYENLVRLRGKGGGSGAGAAAEVQDPLSP